MSNLEDYFSADYDTARRRFRAAAAQAGWECQTVPFSGEGPQGEELALDFAISPASATAPPTMILSSGLHGVEGFFGSAVQCAFLDQSASKGDTTNVRYVLLHALNPYGFAHLRRFDAENIDPNRNFLLPGEEFVGSPKLYCRLDSLLNPIYSPNRWDFFLIQALSLLLRYGLPALKQAIAAGQYEYPMGLFFGGNKPCQTQTVVATNLPQLVGSSQQVVHLDFHTGLGKRGEVKLLLDYLPTDEQRLWLETWYGPDAYEANDARRTAYEARGGLGQWCIGQAFAPNYLPLCVEFGTYSPLAVLAGLRAENHAHHWGEPHSKAILKAKQRLKELFCPAAVDWRRSVVAKSLGIIHQTAAGLAEL